MVAGIFLHDIAKTWELTYETAFAYSDGGQLVGHIVKAAMWVDQKRKGAEAKLGGAVDQILIDVLQHIILSHHGEHEFGSPKLPMTPEAIVVHMLENMDAKLMMALSACRGEGGGVWTEYMKAFGGKMFRPDVAGPDGPPPPRRADREDRPARQPRPPAAEPSRSPEPPRSIEPPTLAEPPKPVKVITITNPLFESVEPKR